MKKTNIILRKFESLALAVRRGGYSKKEASDIMDSLIASEELENTSLSIELYDTEGIEVEQVLHLKDFLQQVANSALHNMREDKDQELSHLKLNNSKVASILSKESIVFAEKSQAVSNTHLLASTTDRYLHCVAEQTGQLVSNHCKTKRKFGKN